MPEINLGQKSGELENEFTRAGNQPRSTVLMRVVEELCSLMSAGGALIALRDTQGVRCVASTGNAPAVGSRLQPDSAFTRECLETGTVVLCEDADADSRIRPSVAGSLHLRSALAVPIRAQGTIVGLVEVFSSRPSAFCATHVAALQQIADLLAAFSTPEPVEGAQPCADAAQHVLAKPDVPWSAEEQSRVQQSATPSPPERQVDSPRPIVEKEFVPSGAARILQRLARKTIAAPRAWLSRASALFLLTLLFLFTGSRLRSIRTSSDRAVPPGSERASRDESGMRPIRALGTVEVPDLKSSEDSSRARVPLSTAPPSLPKAEREESRAARASDLRAAPVEQGLPVMTTNPAPQLADSPSTVPPNLHPIAAAGLYAGSDRDVGSSAPPELGIEGVKLDPFEQAPAEAAMLAVTAAVPPLIRPAGISRPDFVLDRTLRGHSSWVTGVAFSSDGQRLASGSWDQTVRLWNVPTGQQLSTVGSKMKEVQALAFSRDGDWLATENSSNTVTLWDARTGREIRTLPSNRPLGVLGSNWVYSIAFSPDGRWLASGVDDKTVRLWDVRTGSGIRDLTGLRRSVIYAAFSPDGRWLATGDDDKSIRIWEVSTGREIQRLSGHKKPIYAVAFSPNGRWLASASADKSIKLWDIAAGREIHTLTGHGNMVTSLAFSPDGLWIASGSWDKTVRIWDVENGHEVQTLGGHDHPVYSVAFDSRGRWLASGSEDGTINLWRSSAAADQSRSR
jgi:uncharacterized protein with WD repeat